MSIRTICYETFVAVLRIRQFPEPILRERAEPVRAMSDELRRLIQDMTETMYAAPGVGLAAPQVGVSQRVMVLDPDPENPGKRLFKLVNPEIRRAEGEVLWKEGCLSVPDFTAEVRRAARVEVVAFDENEKEIVIEGEGLLAVALQHEIDHLDGKLFLDRISRLKRDLYARRRRKKIRGGQTEDRAPGLLI
jgi:peptide deformylase